MNKKRKIVITTSIVLLAIIITTSFTYGKYVYNSVWNYYLSSKEFYFESDLLDINNKNNSLLKWDGSNVNFVIKNSKNNELISESDISYKVTCEVLGDESEYIKCILNDTDLSIFNGTLSSEANCTNNIDTKDVSKLTKAECEVGGYIWKEEIASKNNYFNLVLTDNTKTIDEVLVKVTAESLSPYKQILTGLFNLNKVDNEEVGYILNYESYDEYDEVSITNTASEKKCMYISFDASNYSVDIDNNSILEYSIDSNDKINGLKFELESENTSYFKLYKLNSEKVYSVNDILLEEKEC